MNELIGVKSLKIMDYLSLPLYYYINSHIIIPYELSKLYISNYDEIESSFVVKYFHFTKGPFVAIRLLWDFRDDYSEFILSVDILCLFLSVCLSVCIPLTSKRLNRSSPNFVWDLTWPQERFINAQNFPNLSQRKKIS